jgi:hypothetical protein
MRMIDTAAVEPDMPSLGHRLGERTAARKAEEE